MKSLTTLINLKFRSRSKSGLYATLTLDATIDSSQFLIKPTDCLFTYNKMYMDMAIWITIYQINNPIQTTVNF